MTNGTTPEAALRWAAGQLGVPENAATVDVRRAYFRKVRECEFLPPQSLRRAREILERRPSEVEPNEDWALEEEGRLRAEVESFAEEFFALPVPQRRQRWEALLVRCAGVPQAQARLHALKPGLDVESQRVPLDETRLGQLAGHLLESFPRSPVGRAAARQAFLARVEEPSAADRKAWEKAARLLQAEWPTLTGLDGELVRRLAKLRRHLKRQREAHNASQQKCREAQKSSGGVLLWLVLLILPGLISGLVRNVSNSNTTPAGRPPAPNFTAAEDRGVLKSVEGLRTKVVTDPQTGASSVQVNLPSVASIQELLDPNKFDVEMVHGGKPRLYRFTPRPETTKVGADRPLANSGQPLLFGEVALMLMGADARLLDRLSARVEADRLRKQRNSEPNPTPQVGPPAPPKSTQRESSPP